MAATIFVKGVRATCRDYQWTCDNKELEVYLNSLLDPGGPGGDDPNPDYNAAVVAVDEVGGRIISYDKTEYVEGRTY